MNHTRHIRRLTAALAGLAGTLLAFSAGAPAAFATPPPGSPLHTPPPQPGPVAHTIPVTHTVVTGGMPGWQIALIAIGAALIAATAAVLAYRARATRRKPVTAAA